MGPIIALALKDIRHLLRDKGAAFFTLVFPLLVAMFFGSIFGGRGGGGGTMPIAVVNEDGREASAAFVKDLADDAALKVTMAAARSEGEQLVRKGKVVACIVVPKDFGDAADNMFAGVSLRVEGVIDPSKQSEAGLLTGKLNEVAFKQMSRTFGDTNRLSGALDSARTSIMRDDEIPLANKALFGIMFESIKSVAKARDKDAAISPGTAVDKKESSGAAADEGVKSIAAGGWRPVEVTLTELSSDRAAPRSGYEVSFTQGVIWGLMGCVTAFGASMAAERTRGTLMRLTIAPITRKQILAGKALSCFMACLFVQLILILFGMLVYKIRIGNPGLMAVAMLASAVGFTGVMMFIAGLTRTEGAGAGMGRALILVLAMIGGGTVPIFIMPPLIQTLSKVSPFSWATLCFEGAIWRGFTAAEMAVPALVLVGFGVAGFVIGSASLKVGEGTG